MFSTILIFIIVLSVIVFAHEAGHFFTARLFGVRAEEFGFGFPPRILGFYKNRRGKRVWLFNNQPVENLETSLDENVRPAEKATLYSLNWLPLGGFVKIKGENGEGQGEADSFAAKKIWQRAIILVAGVLMNVVLAWLLFSLGYMFGLPQSTDMAGPKAIITESSVMLSAVLPDSPAESAGLKVGDAILAVNGEAVGTEVALQDAIAANDGLDTELLVRRDNQEEKIMVTPTIQSGSRATIGVGIYASALIRYPFFSAIVEGAKTTGWLTKEIFVAFGNLLSSIFDGQSVADQFAGPVGIANITGQAAREGFIYLLQFIALLSLNLAVINILPFPALDGGRLLFLIIERIKGSPVKREMENVIHNIGFFLLIALVLFITYKDIAKLVIK